MDRNIWFDHDPGICYQLYVALLGFSHGNLETKARTSRLRHAATGPSTQFLNALIEWGGGVDREFLLEYKK